METKYIVVIVVAVLLIGAYLKKKKDRKKDNQSDRQPVTINEPTDSLTNGIFITSDIARVGEKSDKDDNQAWGWTLAFLNRFKLEALVSTNAYTSDVPNSGVEAFREIVADPYNQIYHEQNLASKGYPSPEHVGSKAVAGSRGTDETYRGFNEGAQAIITAAKRYSPTNQLTGLIWGACTTLAQAIHRDPSIVPNLRILAVMSWNTDQDQESFDYLRNNHPTLLFCGDEAAHSGIRNKNSSYKAPGQRLASTDELHKWLREVFYSIPHMEAFWKRFAIHANSKQDPYRIKAGDFLMLYCALYPKYYNGNFTKRDGSSNFWYDDDISFFSKQRDEIYTILENHLVNLGLDPAKRWF